MRQSSLRLERELCAISVWCSETSPGSAGSPRVTCRESVGVLLFTGRLRSKLSALPRMRSEQGRACQKTESGSRPEEYQRAHLDAFARRRAGGQRIWASPCNPKARKAGEARASERAFQPAIPSAREGEPVTQRKAMLISAGKQTAV